MNPVIPRLGRLLLALTLAAAGAGAAAQAPGLKASGSIKSLQVDSRTPSGASYALSLTRGRLALQGEVAPGLAIDLQYDQEWLLGSYLHTAEFQVGKDAPMPQYWRADANLYESGDVYARHKVYRGWLRFSQGPVDATLGRQRIAWGTGRFWSPLDILNPLNPLAVEREERLGIDALLVEVKTGPLSRISAVHVPAPDRGRPSRAVLWHGNAAGADVSLVAGQFADRHVLGADVATQWGQAGVRAELARFAASNGASFRRALVGLDYALDGGLTVSGELSYNGAGVRDTSRYDLRARGSGESRQLATRYAGLYVAYEFTPLLKWLNYVAYNVDDRSGGLDSRLTWSPQPSIELTAGVQTFRGSGRSEYGRLPSTLLVQGQWYF
jgi:hypothetical protein